MSFPDVSSILWRERRLLDVLECKVVEQQLLVDAGHTRWLDLATREIQAVLDELRDTELLRAIAVARAAADLGLAADVPLRELTAAAPPPWNALLAEHRTALRVAVERVENAAQAHRGQLADGAHALRQRLRSTLEVVVPDA